MSIERETLILIPRGRLDTTSTADFERQVMGHVSEGTTRLALDFDHLDFVMVFAIAATGGDLYAADPGRSMEPYGVLVVVYRVVLLVNIVTGSLKTRPEDIHVVYGFGIVVLCRQTLRVLSPEPARRCGAAPTPSSVGQRIASGPNASGSISPRT